jgi:hypothetical protein
MAPTRTGASAKHKPRGKANPGMAAGREGPLPNIKYQNYIGDPGGRFADPRRHFADPRGNFLTIGLNKKEIINLRIDKIMQIL